LETRLLDSDPPVSAAAPVALRESRLMRRVNSNVRQLSATFADSEPIGFFCECQNPACYSGIWMSEAAFDAMVADQTGWLLLEGHEPIDAWHRREAAPARETNEAERGGSVGPSA
jgi:hypothetical protein